MPCAGNGLREKWCPEGAFSRNARATLPSGNRHRLSPRLSPVPACSGPPRLRYAGSSCATRRRVTVELVGNGEEPRWDNGRHFFATAAGAIRRILVENARRKQMHKHGGGRQRRDLGAEALVAAESNVDLLGEGKWVPSKRPTPQDDAWDDEPLPWDGSEDPPG
jgi:hypothetical protein